MENKKDFVFEKPKLPLWFMKSCLDYLLVQPKLNLSELTSELKGKLDKEERMEAISWFERNGFIETTDEKKVLRITKEKYLAFCTQFYPFTYPFSKALEQMDLPYMLLMAFYRGLNFDDIEPLSKLVKKETLDYMHGKKSVTIETLDNTLQEGVATACRVLGWLEFKGYVEFTGEDWKVLLTDEQYKEIDSWRPVGSKVSKEIEYKKAALDCIKSEGFANISLIQRTLGCGYPLAGKLIEWMECEGYIGTFDGAKHRKVLITDEQYEAFIKENFGENSEKN